MLKNEKLDELLESYKKSCQFLVDNYKINIDAYFSEIDDYELMTVVNAVISECERDKTIMLKWFNQQTKSVIDSDDYYITDVDDYASEMHHFYMFKRDTLESEKQKYLQRFTVGLNNKRWCHYGR